MQNVPIVAIKCLVFNHEPYLRDCLNGFVMQQTDFPFVAIVHDDASTDKSADIIREYAAKYPDIIRPIYETENQYSKGTLSKVMNEAVDATGAKYIALCEGDDYWTDPKKLQKQVDFMEAHPEYVMCFHKVDVISPREEERHMYDHLQEREYTAYEVYDRWTIPTCSVVYRAACKVTQTPKGFAFGDIYLFLSLLQQGRAYCLGFVGGVYRRHTGGVSVDISPRLCRSLVYQYKTMEHIFPDLRTISVRKKLDYLDGTLYDTECRDTWKYRFYYMGLHKRLFLSSFCTTTLLTYMLKPFCRILWKKH